MACNCRKEVGLEASMRRNCSGVVSWPKCTDDTGVGAHWPRKAKVFFLLIMGRMVLVKPGDAIPVRTPVPLFCTSAQKVSILLHFCSPMCLEV